MSLTRLSILSLIVFSSHTCVAQADSALQQLQELPKKYITVIDTKIDKYQHRITNKTEKTLTKLAKWENKIKILLEKASPETAQRLFGEGKPTFNSVLAQYKKGETDFKNYRHQYNEYLDKLSNNINYINQQKDKLQANVVNPAKTAKEKLDKLEDEEAKTQAIQQFIKQRKAELINEALKHLGKNKYLSKINKEAYYYAETLKNYREILADPVKVENIAMGLLKKIPGFNDFFNQNSSYPSINGGASTSAVAANSNYAAMGYQSNASVAQVIQQSRASGPSVQQLTQQSANGFNSPLQQLKNQFPNLSSTDEMPDFKPNEMRSKTFKQRLVTGTNLQFGKATNFLPGTADIGMQLAYKLNTNSSLGFGGSYKLSLGSGINNIKLGFAGLGVRSFMDWKIKGNFFVNGGLEYNYNTAIITANTNTNTAINNWKPAALLGINKKYTVGNVKGNAMLLFDFLAKQQIPQTQYLIFRVGYNF